MSSAPAVGNATVTFSSAGVSKALAVPIVQAPAARVELVCPDSVCSGKSFKLEIDSDVKVSNLKKQIGRRVGFDTKMFFHDEVEQAPPEVDVGVGEGPGIG